MACKDLHKTTAYLDPELNTWMRHQMVIEDVTKNDLINEALALLKKSRASLNQRLAHVMATKKTTAIHPAKKGGKK